MKISKEMMKAIAQAKEEAINLMPNIPAMHSIKIRRKVTKNKLFEFQIINMGRPAIRLFINNRFYRSYIFIAGRWSENR